MPPRLGHHHARTKSRLAARPQRPLLPLRQNLRPNPRRTGLGGRHSFDSHPLKHKRRVSQKFSRSVHLPPSAHRSPRNRSSSASPRTRSVHGPLKAVPDHRRRQASRPLHRTEFPAARDTVQSEPLRRSLLARSAITPCLTLRPRSMPPSPPLG